MDVTKNTGSRPISDEEYEELCRNEILEEIWRAEHEEAEEPYFDDDGYYHGPHPHKKRGLPPDEYYNDLQVQNNQCDLKGPQNRIL